MITSIYVNGFRSLINFTLSLKPGINILVGSNGSGKTNIIAFFEFLSQIITSGASEAINNLGGASSVFSKCCGSSDEFQNDLKAKVIGSVKNNSKYLNYSYSFTISILKDFNKIEFKSQVLNICTTDNFSETYPEDVLSLTIHSTQPGSKYKYELFNYDKNFTESSFLSIMNKKINKNDNKSTIQEIFNHFIDDETSLITAIRYIFDERLVIASDICSGQMFNFIPARIKTPEDISSKIGIQKDGSGLAATLYAIETRSSIEKEMALISSKYDLRNRIGYNLNNASMADIMKYIKVANKSIEKISAFNDKFENLIKIKFTLKEDNGSIVLPITSMSDGTIKWLSFVTAILTSPTVFSIEEPENYLHPLMQNEVIKLIRDSIETKQKESSIIMSTHSETILNNAFPDEIIITEFKDGATFAKRCANADDIKKEIKATGFGLGYYYIAGSIEYE